MKSRKLKRFVVKLEIADSLIAFVYVQAQHVKLVSHERIQVDRAILDLPGTILEIKP